VYHISQEVKKNTIENAKRGKEKGPGPTWPIDVIAFLGLFGWGETKRWRNSRCVVFNLRRPLGCFRSPAIPFLPPLPVHCPKILGGSTGMATVGGA